MPERDCEDQVQVGVGEGTGQGLSLAYSCMANRHGGSIRVISAPGEGAVFTLTLSRTAARIDDGNTARGATFDRWCPVTSEVPQP